MTLPVAQDVYDELSDFGVDSNEISQTKVERYLRQAVSYVQKKLGRELDKETTITGFYSGDGSNSLLLNHKKINSIESVQYFSGRESQYSGVTTYELSDIGTIVLTPGGVFRKGDSNIKVVYKVGGPITDDEKDAVILTASEFVLNEVANRDGENISSQGWGKTQGDRGEFSSYKNDLMRRVDTLLCDQVTGIGGQV